MLCEIILLPYYRNSILCPVNARLSYNFVIMITTCFVIASPSKSINGKGKSKIKIWSFDVRIRIFLGLVDSMYDGYLLLLTPNYIMTQSLKLYSYSNTKCFYITLWHAHFCFEVMS